MDAITLLREDHRAVKKLMTRFDKGDDAVVPEILDALDRHAAIEEEHFYPAVKAALEEKDIVLESVEEHHVVHLLIGELRQMTPDDETYRAKATVLVENVRHHIDEEEGELFPQVREALGRKDLQQLAETMTASPAMQERAEPQAS
jgi:hemerythrin superfamily protein